MPSSAVSFLFARKRNPFFSFLFADYGNVQKPLWRRVQWQWGYKKSLQWFYLQLQSILHLLTFKVWPLHVGICIRLFGNQGNSMCRRVLILLQLLHFNHHFAAISLMWPPLESVQLHSRGARSISSYQNSPTKPNRVHSISRSMNKYKREHTSIEEIPNTLNLWDLEKIK